MICFGPLRGCMPVAARDEARVREFLPLSRSLCPTKAKDCLGLGSCDLWTAVRIFSVLNVLIFFYVTHLTLGTWSRNWI